MLIHALNLLGRLDGPVLMDVFKDDPPGWSDTVGWRPGFSRADGPLPPPDDVRGWSAVLAREMEQVRPLYERSVRDRGRTSIGVSRQSPQDWPDYAAAFLGGALPAPPEGLPTPAVALRFLSDDLKAYYGEAIQAAAPAPSSRQVDRWFWSQTVAGELLQAVRRVGLASESNSLKTVAGRFLVPGPYVVA